METLVFVLMIIGLLILIVGGGYIAIENVKDLIKEK